MCPVDTHTTPRGKQCCLAVGFNVFLTIMLQAIMDRQKIDELPAMQVQFFETTGLPVFKVSHCLNAFFRFSVVPLI